MSIAELSVGGTDGGLWGRWWWSVGGAGGGLQELSAERPWGHPALLCEVD